MKYLIIAFIASVITNWIFVRFKLKFLLDHDEGVQKFHTSPTPRIGGLGVFVGFLAFSLVSFWAGKPFGKDLLLLVLVAFPVFLTGIIEDFTKKVTPRSRLLAAFISGILAVFFLDAGLNRVDVLGIDYLLSNFPLVSVLFTVFALAGISNAMNIIDGFNGLAAGVSIIIFITYSYVSFVTHDFFLLYLSLAMVATIFGFFIFNFPFGKIFLGDGCSYFIGFLEGVVGLLLVKRHDEVSAWFGLMTLAYPVFETVFSIIRKKFIRKGSPFEPDGIHFHMLIHKRIIKKRYSRSLPVIQNSLTSPYLWGLQILASTSALLFWKNTMMLIISFIIFCTVYIYYYFKIVRFGKMRLGNG